MNVSIKIASPQYKVINDIGMFSLFGLDVDIIGKYLTSRSNSTIACFVRLYLHQMSWAVLSYQYC